MIGSALLAGAVGATGVAVVPSGVAAAASRTLTVDTTADSHDAHPGDGACADSSGRCSLRAAIEEANAEAKGTLVTIDVPSGTYKLKLGTLSITRNAVSIDGSGTVVLKEKGTHRFMSVGPVAQASVTDVTIEGGNAGTGSGGGLSNSGLTTLGSVTITGSTAARGGGVYNARGGTLDFDASTVSNSTAANGSRSSRPGGSGGGILNAGSLTLYNTTVSGNSAGSGGPGLNKTAGAGGNGGGIDNTGTALIIASTVNSNVAGSGGMGLDGDEASGAGGDGGGLYSSPGSSVTVNESVMESDVSGSSGPSGESPFPHAGDGGAIWSAGTLDGHGERSGVRHRW